MAEPGRGFLPEFNFQANLEERGYLHNMPGIGLAIAGNKHSRSRSSWTLLRSALRDWRGSVKACL